MRTSLRDTGTGTWCQRSHDNQSHQSPSQHRDNQRFNGNVTRRRPVYTDLRQIGRDLIQETLLAVITKAATEGGVRRVSLRLGAVVYRDRGDTYVTKMHQFTDNIFAFEGAMKEIQACCGGDMQESVNEALATAVSALAWRRGAAAVAFLIGVMQRSSN